MKPASATASTRKRARWLPLAGLLLMGGSAAWIAASTWISFNGYRPPYAPVPREDHGSRPLTERLVVVLLDGLRLDASRSMTYLDELRRRGADFDCRTGIPSLSLAGRATLLTGTWPEIHGQLFNFEPRLVRVEALFESARRRGLRTALAADPSIHEMFGVAIDGRVVYRPETLDASTTLEGYIDDLRRIVESARPLLREEGPGLVFVDLYTIDQAGHQWGGGSAEYAAAVRAVDDALRRLAEDVDLDRATLVVVSDHGHTDRGGHGGDEPAAMQVPLVLAGRGVRAGVRGTARHIDMAPTIAGLLGAAIPSSSQGRVLFEALDVEGEPRMALLRAACEQRATAVSAYAGTTTLHASPFDDAATEPELLTCLDAVDRFEAEFREARLHREAGARAAGALAVAAVPLLLIAAVAACGFRAELRRAAVFGAAGVALYFALFPVAGLSTSLSAINKDEELKPFFATNMILAAALAAVTATLAARAGGARRAGLDPVAVAGLTLLVFASPLVAGIGHAFWRAGFAIEWALASMRWTMALYLDALAVAAVGLTSPLAMAMSAFPTSKRFEAVDSREPALE